MSYRCATWQQFHGATIPISIHNCQVIITYLNVTLYADIRSSNKFQRFGQLMIGFPFNSPKWCNVIYFISKIWLTHWGRDKMASISQTTLSSAFPWMKMFEFWIKFHLCSRIDSDNGLAPTSLVILPTFPNHHAFTQSSHTSVIYWPVLLLFTTMCPRLTH